GQRTFVLIAHAALRRKRRHRKGIEFYSELRALEAAERADVALVLVDSSEGIVEQDIAVADVARHADCSTLVVLSKWDATTIGVDDVRSELRRRLRARPEAQPPLRRADPCTPPAVPLLRQRPRTHHARLRLLGREPAARALRPRRRPGLDRLRETILRCVFWLWARGRGGRRSRASSS